MRSVFASLLVLLLFSSPVNAQQVRTEVRRLGVAPLLGQCPTRERLVQLANQKRQLLYEAVIQAGHSPAVAHQVVEALCLGQVEQCVLPNGTGLATMAWFDGYRVRTLPNPELLLGGDVMCWQLRVTVQQKTIVWVLPWACGNLARLKVETRVVIIPEIPPPPVVEIPPPGFAYAPGAKRSTTDRGEEVYRGATSSSFQISFFPKVNVNQSQNNSNSNSNVNSNSNSNWNNQVGGGANVNFNPSIINQNNNNAIAQAQNVVPVNVVVNTGPGNASGTATGSGVQDAGSGQTNNVGP